MNPEQVQYGIDTYGIENLLFIQLNNSKTLTLTPEDRKELKIIYDKEILEFSEKSYGQTLRYVVPFSFIEGLIFKDNKEKNNSMTMDGNSLLVDENGKLDTNNW